MDVQDLAPALRDRLGRDATLGLLACLEVAQEECAATVTNAAVERFEGRLTLEFQGLRKELQDQVAGLREEVRTQVADVREEMRDQVGGVREEVRNQVAALREDVRGQFAGIREDLQDKVAGVRREMQDQTVNLRLDMQELGRALRQEQMAGRLELLKWSFAFWVGQVLAVAGIVGVMLRLSLGGA